MTSSENDQPGVPENVGMTVSDGARQRVCGWVVWVVWVYGGWWMVWV